MIRFFERPMAVCGSADDAGFSTAGEYIDAIWAGFQASVAGGHPATRARCAGNIVDVLTGRTPGTTPLLPGDPPCQQIWCDSLHGNIVLWEDISLLPGDVVFD